MTQEQALNILKTGANVFLTGEPGAGKTHTVNAFVEYLRNVEIDVAITASTGIAATHIGGMTIHSWSGIGIKNKLDKYELDKIASSEYVAKRVRRTKVLIIDEVSMLSGGTLDMVDMVCREVKQKSEPFGGIQMVLVGDFFQLPPIVKTVESNNKQLFADVENSTQGNFAYGSGAWARARLVTCYLSEQHRQDDANFLSILSAIRADNLKNEHKEHILSRTIDEYDMPENTTKLFSHNFNVDKVNDLELSKLEDEKRIFRMTSMGNDKLVEILKKGCLSPENLELKVGAVVMCTKNNPKEGYVNGTLATVVDYDEFTGEPIIRNKVGKTIKMQSADWSVEENGKIRAMISQIPLRLAWSITVHKSQGMSMDSAVMDLSQVFEFGQGYVALSRVRRLSGLYLLGINDHAFKVHPEVLKQDKIFKTESENAEKVFGALAVDELVKMHRNFVIANGGKVNDKVKGKTKPHLATGSPSAAASNSKGHGFDAIREKHPNAYRPWSAEQDQELSKLFNEGVEVDELVGKFGRKRGGITARLKKLGLINE